MTLEEMDHDPMEVRDRTLQENYEPHTMGQNYLEARLEGFGYDTVQIGDENPEAEKMLMSVEGAPDVGILDDDGDIIACVEIKTKRASGGDEWFGRLNQRHWDNYLSWSGENSVPVFIWFCLLDEEDGVMCRHGFIEAKGWKQVEESMGPIKGNIVLQLKEKRIRSFMWLAHRLAKL